MTTWIECREPDCVAPATAVGDAFYMDGVGMDGKDIRVWYEKRHCAAGHWNTIEIYEEDR